MPRLIKKGNIIEDTWFPMNPDVVLPASGQICTLPQWQQLIEKNGSAVQLEVGQEPTPLFPFLREIKLVVINFPVFTDGRGFSYARDLRERGYCGELRACGYFIRDQLTYLHRCGFDAFQMADESGLDSALASFRDFSEHYQAAIDQPLPLFRRRAQTTH
jgi:uncharacterized protein (DUF934 family)